MDQKNPSISNPPRTEVEMVDEKTGNTEHFTALMVSQCVECGNERLIQFPNVYTQCEECGSKGNKSNRNLALSLHVSFAGFLSGEKDEHLPEVDQYLNKARTLTRILRSATQKGWELDSVTEVEQSKEFNFKRQVDVDDDITWEQLEQEATTYTEDLEELKKKTRQ